MATVEEVLAKADAWEKAGRPENAAKLRAYAETLKPAAPKYDAATVEAKALEWEKAGQPEKAAKLREYAATLPKVEQPKPKLADMPTAEAPGAGQAQTEEQMRASRFAQFEEANPSLKGRYTPDNFPGVGDVVMGTGGGGRSGGARYTVKPYAGAGKADTFGDTAAEMVQGPLAAAGEFAGGLVGGESPSYNYLRESGAPRFIAGPLSKVGDLGGAGLSLVGAGISGLAGLAAEAMPGQGDTGERKLAEDLTGMSMFAVPELAGVASVPARVAAAAPKAPPVATVVPKLADDVAAAERLGIPVMRTDVKPPETALGKIVQRAGESIPVAGTAGMRAKQFRARADAVERFISEYVGDNIAPAIDAVTENFRKVHGEAVSRLSKQKDAVIKSADAAGEVPVPKAVAAIDAQIAKLAAAKNEGFKPIIAELENFKASITGQKMSEIDMNRAYIGKVFDGIDAAKIKDAGEKALSAIYGPLKEDMAAFIGQATGKAGLKKWTDANKALHDLADGQRNTLIRNALKKGEMTPEATGRLLFSQNPSDVRALYSKLDEAGRASARTAIVQKAMEKATGVGAEGMTPTKFRAELMRLGKQTGVFFKGDDLDAAEGLVRALQLTEQAAKAGAAPLTGAQNVPAVITLMVSSLFDGSMGATAAALGTVGGIARIYESTGVKSALRRLAKAENPKAQATILKSLEKALKDAGMPATQGGAQAANAPTPPQQRALP